MSEPENSRSEEAERLASRLRAVLKSITDIDIPEGTPWCPTFGDLVTWYDWEVVAKPKTHTDTDTDTGAHEPAPPLDLALRRDVVWNGALTAQTASAEDDGGVEPPHRRRPSVDIVIDENDLSTHLTPEARKGLSIERHRQALNTLLYRVAQRMLESVEEMTHG